MAFCDHCEGQRFDRSRVLRRLRELRRELRAARGGAKADEAIEHALNAVRALDIPHLELEHYSDDVVLH
jgi:hypothetical protein